MYASSRSLFSILPLNRLIQSPGTQPRLGPRRRGLVRLIRPLRLPFLRPRNLPPHLRRLALLVQAAQKPARDPRLLGLDLPQCRLDRLVGSVGRRAGRAAFKDGADRLCVYVGGRLGSAGGVDRCGILERVDSEESCGERTG